MNFLRSSLIAAPHGFTTRAGGVSTGPYAALNLSTATGDDPAAVTENRRRALAAFGGAGVGGGWQGKGPERGIVGG
ncbi:laccase domain-containing protein, partial [Oceanithermus sp.]